MRIFNRMMKRIQFLLCALCFIGCQARRPNPVLSGSSLINLDHLNALCENIMLDTVPVAIVHIYSEYPDYQWVDANREGIACVDDVARAAVVTMKYYELTKDATILGTIRKLLNFVLFMQTPDGEFYNFLDRNHQINRIGETSRKAFNFWAARGYWALGCGTALFRKLDSPFSEILRERFLRCKGPIKDMLEKYGTYRMEKGRSYPLWLVNTSGGDATSELLLGLECVLAGQKDPELIEYGEKLADGIIRMQLDSTSAYPGAFLSWINTWHAWGNAQTQALAGLGGLLNNLVWISSAEKEARLFIGPMVRSGFIHSISFENGIDSRIYPQIAYDIRPVVAGLVRLSGVTRQKQYGEMAGLAAAWFFGRNPARQVMYDMRTGRCFDGIAENGQINRNSGAESTIEALYSIMEVLAHPAASRTLFRWLEEQDDQVVSIEHDRAFETEDDR